MSFSSFVRFGGLSLCLTSLLNACGGGSDSAAPLYSVGGSLSGLAAGASVKLQNSGGDTTAVAANGTFSFSKQVANGTRYTVTVLTQPTGQTCAVTAGSGTVSGANVSSIQVTCATNKYTISGTVSGLRTGAQVIVQNNAGDST